jgi:hypothetical protein
MEDACMLIVGYLDFGIDVSNFDLALISKR